MISPYKTMVLTLFAVVGIGLLAGGIIIWGGYYNVAASVPHTSYMTWIFKSVQERSIKHHADGVAPGEYGFVRVMAGAIHFHGDCMICHTAPGIERTPFSEGMNPVPPDLHHIFDEFDAVEVHWILMHGIKMSGMPGFMETHNAEEMWDVVAFLHQLPGMTVEDYQRLLPNLRQGEPEDDADAEVIRM